MRRRVGHRETGRAARASREPVSDVNLWRHADVARIRPMSCSSEDDPSENVSPQLDALVAMALVLLLGDGTRVGYLVARIARWLV